MILLKNPQFLRNHYETHEYHSLTKFHIDCVKIVDFLNKSIFLDQCQFRCHILYNFCVFEIFQLLLSSINPKIFWKIFVFKFYSALDFIYYHQNRLLDLVRLCLDRLFQFNHLNRNRLNRRSRQSCTKSNSLLDY